MARITVANLKAEIEEVNQKLKDSGSDYWYRYWPRNGYHAVDIHTNNGMVNNLDAAEPPRVLIEKLQEDYKQYLGKKCRFNK